MRHFLFLIAAGLCLYAPGAAAQNVLGAKDDRIFYAGFTAGGNFCELIGDSYHGYQKLGYYAGAVAFGKISPRFAGSLALQYANKGSRGVREINSLYVGQMYEKYYLDLNYVEAVAQLWCKTTRSLWLGGGVVDGRLLSSSESVSTDQPVILHKERHEFLKKDFSLKISAFYTINKHWIVDAGYQRSLRPVRNWDKVPLYFGAGKFNIHFSAGLTYLL